MIKLQDLLKQSVNEITSSQAIEAGKDLIPIIKKWTAKDEDYLSFAYDKWQELLVKKYKIDPLVAIDIRNHLYSIHNRHNLDRLHNVAYGVIINLTESINESDNWKTVKIKSGDTLKPGKKYKIPRYGVEATFIKFDRDNKTMHLKSNKIGKIRTSIFHAKDMVLVESINEGSSRVKDLLKHLEWALKYSKMKTTKPGYGAWAGPSTPPRELYDDHLRDINRYTYTKLSQELGIFQDIDKALDDKKMNPNAIEKIIKKVKVSSNESVNEAKKFEPLEALKHLGKQGYSASKIKMDRELGGAMSFKVDGKVIGRLNAKGELVDLKESVNESSYVDLQRKYGDEKPRPRKYDKEDIYYAIRGQLKRGTISRYDDDLRDKINSYASKFEIQITDDDIDWVLSMLDE